MDMFSGLSHSSHFLDANSTTNLSDGHLSTRTLPSGRQSASRKLPDSLIIPSSRAPQIAGGSRPSTASSNSWRPPPSPVKPTYNVNGIHSRDSTLSNMNPSSSSSHMNRSSLSEHSHLQQSGRHERFLEPDCFLGSPHEDHPLSFDRASKTSTQSSLETRGTGLWSRISVATSITSLSSRRSTKAPELDLEIPSHSLGTLFGNRSKSTKSARKGVQGILAQSSQTSPVYTNTLQYSRTGQSPLTSSSGCDWDQEILQLTAEPSSQTTRTNSTRTDSLLNLSPIEQAIQSRLPTFHVVRGAVTSGTLEGLVQFLITGFSFPGHTYYRDTFLTACSELTTPEDLFQILSYRLDEEQHASDDRSSTQYTIFMFIVYWLKSNSFPPNEELLYRIKFFCEEAARRYPPLDSIAKETRQLIDVKVAPPTRLPASNPKAPILKTSQITPRDLAIALGLLEGDHYKALQPSDYLQHLSKGQSDRVKIYNETNEQIKLWVIRSILYYDTVSSRSQLVKFYVNTAFECYSMRNFSSTVAISSALQSVSIENLKATMKATRKALSKKMQARLPLLSEIIDPQSNHRGYLNALQTAATVQERDTCIPWLAVHLKELDRVVRQPLTVLVDDHYLVNFTRYNSFMDRVKEILYYLPPDLEDKRHGGQLTYLLNQLRDIDLSGDMEQQLSAKGEEIGARESSVNNMHNEHLRRVGFAVP